MNQNKIDILRFFARYLFAIFFDEKNIKKWVCSLGCEVRIKNNKRIFSIASLGRIINRRNVEMPRSKTCLKLKKIKFKIYSIL